jgi:hypothetical protein
MNGKHRVRIVFAAVVALGLAGLACSTGLGSPTQPASPIPVSTESAGQLESAWETAVANPQNGQVTVVMTEQQITSYAAIKLAADPQSPIQNPQIFLRNGQMSLYGTAKANGVLLPVAIGLSIAPAADGTVSVTIQSINFGPFPAPASLRDTLSSSINNLITTQVANGNTNFKVTDIKIGDGQMTVTGTVSQ